MSNQLISLSVLIISSLDFFKGFRYSCSWLREMSALSPKRPILNYFPPTFLIGRIILRFYFIIVYFLILLYIT